MWIMQRQGLEVRDIDFPVISFYLRFFLFGRGYLLLEYE
jgi:hypothetical protein